MKANPNFWKNWSTYGNFLLTVVPAIVALTVDMGLSEETRATVALVGGMIVHILQSIKQEANSDESSIP